MRHWTNELFREHPELFLTVLEDRVPRAACEVDLLLKRIREQKLPIKRVLDLNCGVGRHSIELAKRGVNVLGTDLSALYIKIAKEKARKNGVENRAEFKISDMRRIHSQLADEKPFDGIVNLFTSFGFYDDKTNEDVLRHCAGLVRSGGFFALEIVNRDHLIKHFQPEEFSRHENMIILEDRDLDVMTSRMKSTWTYLVQKDKKTFVEAQQVTLDHRVWSAHELIEMFRRTGWTTKTIGPGFNEKQADVSLREARSLLLIAKKAQSGSAPEIGLEVDRKG